jgi:hypothetical protein
MVLIEVLEFVVEKDRVWDSLINLKGHVAMVVSINGTDGVIVCIYLKDFVTFKIKPSAEGEE